MNTQDTSSRWFKIASFIDLDGITEAKTRKSWKSMWSAYCTEHTDIRGEQSTMGRTQQEKVH